MWFAVVYSTRGEAKGVYLISIDRMSGLGVRDEAVSRMAAVFWLEAEKPAEKDLCSLPGFVGFCDPWNLCL